MSAVGQVVVFPPGSFDYGLASGSAENDPLLNSTLAKEGLVSDCESQAVGVQGVLTHRQYNPPVWIPKS